MSTVLPPRPTDATLSVTKAARLLGVHPNTVRAWSDAGRLRYYRINPRGDRRYRMLDLQRFLAAAERAPSDQTSPSRGAWRMDRGAGRHARASLVGATPASRPRIPDAAGAAPGAAATTDRGGPERSDGRRAVELTLLDELARAALGAAELEDRLARVAERIRETGDQALVAIWEARGDRLRPVACASRRDVYVPALSDLPRGFGVLGRAIEAAPTRSPGMAGGDRPAVALVAEPRDRISLTILPTAIAETAAAIPGRDGPWGVVLAVGDEATSVPVPSLDGSVDDGVATALDPDFLAVVADALGPLVGIAWREEEVTQLIHRAEALRRVTGDIGSRLDLDRILAGLVDHAMVLFEADRGAVYLRRPDGTDIAEVSRGLSKAYLDAVRADVPRSLSRAAVAARRPLFAVGYRDDPRGTDVRAAVVQEGFDTICTAPLLDGAEHLGTLVVYHDTPHPWSEDELETIDALATQGSVAIRTAQNFQQMATWTAQLQSIQQLGARLSHLSSVREIGTAIATELRQLIDYHNVRVYRLQGDALVPVAMQGQVGEYVDETPDQLRVALGEGITGWVALHRVPQNLPDAAKDPRANTIPGTEDDLDESMLLAPMLFEEQVLGVLVLSKLGLHQFTDDDLRLLTIYANFAAQAMANADTTERLREQSTALARQVRSQRELLSLTESILSTLDARAVLEGITERLGGLIDCDNIAIEVVDPATGLLTPLTARGIHAAYYLEPWGPGETGIATWVVEHNEPVHIGDERSDPRVNQFRETEGVAGSLIVVPLRGRTGAIGVLTIERLGSGNTFTEGDFDLVKLFAAQVSIALQNAEVFRAVEIRAQSDDLTGLLNHGSFMEYLGRSVRDGSPFGVIMLDLDDFKGVNDTMGHQAGDGLLRRIGEALVSAGRETDLVFRYGGDEFAYLLPYTDAEGTRHVAERARAAVKGIGGGVTGSFGMASYPADGTTAESVLLAADRACYVAKRGGRDQVATAAEGMALAAEFSLQAPTPVDSATAAG